MACYPVKPFWHILKLCGFILVFFLASCNTGKELETDKVVEEAIFSKNSLNSDSIIEIKQEFIEKNSSGDYLSESYQLNILNKEFVLISAYTLDNTTNSNFYYAISPDTTWNDWIKVSPNHTINNNRTVYSGTNVFTDISEIRFKSDQLIKQPLIIRIFIAH
jgi:hypothetical protein